MRCSTTPTPPATSAVHTTAQRGHGESSRPGRMSSALEAWFKTNSTTGGKIVGFGNAQSGLSASYDRHIYMDNTGHVIFGVYNGATYTVTSTAAYNNNDWHHVVGTLSGSGMALYVDGKRVGVNQGTTIGQSYSGYWRVGGDNLGVLAGHTHEQLLQGCDRRRRRLPDRADAAAGAVALPRQRAHVDRCRPRRATPTARASTRIRLICTGGWTIQRARPRLTLRPTACRVVTPEA